MKRLSACLMAAACAVFGFSPAHADEIRFGLNGHDVLGLDAGVSGKENSLALTANFVSSRLSDSGWVPRIEVGGNLNTGGKTNFLYGGGLWRGYFGAGKRFYIEGSFGLGVHDGKLEVPNLVPGLPIEEVERRIFENAHFIEFGSRVLFREAIGLGYRFNDQFAADIYFEHFSHGKILSSGPNEGLDTIGVRLSYQLP